MEKKPLKKLPKKKLDTSVESSSSKTSPVSSPNDSSSSLNVSDNINTITAAIPLDRTKFSKEPPKKTKKKGSHSNQLTDDSFSELHIATLQGNYQKVKESLDSHTIDPNAATPKKYITPLRILESGCLKRSNCNDIAAFCGKLGLIELLVEYGASINIRDKQGSSALHYACFRSHKECVEYLLLKGSDVNTSDNTGDTALHKVAYVGCHDIIPLLLSTGAHVDADNFGLTPLHIAVLEGNHQCLAQFLKFENVRKFIDAKDAVSNNSPLLLATLVGAVECVEILFNYGASGSKDAQAEMVLRHDPTLLHVTNALGETPLHMAALSANKDGKLCVKLLLKHGAKVNAIDNKGNTPIFNAALSGRKSICKTLVKAGADVFVQNFKHETALDAAIKEAHTRVSKFLNSIERAHRAALNSKPINEHPPEQNTTNNNASESEAHYKEFSITSEDSKQMVATLQQLEEEVPHQVEQQQQVVNKPPLIQTPMPTLSPMPVIRDLSMFNVAQVIKGQKAIRNYLNKKKKKQDSMMQKSSRVSTEASQLRKLAIKDLLQSEISFLSSLIFLIQRYQTPLELLSKTERAILSSKEVTQLFGNIEQIKDLSKKLVVEINQQKQVGKVFIDALPEFQHYVTYAQSFDARLSLYSSISTNMKFIQFDRDCQQNKPSKVAQTLRDYLALPLKRMEQLHLILTLLKKYTPPGHQGSDHSDINLAVDNIQLIYQQLKQLTKRNEDKDVLRVKHMLTGYNEDLALSLNRKFLKEGSLLYHRPHGNRKLYQKYHLFLFNDLLIVAKLPTETQPMYEYVETLKLETISQVEPISDTNNLIELSFFQKKDKVLMNAKSQEEKLEWILAIKGAIRSLIDTDPQKEEEVEGLF